MSRLTRRLQQAESALLSGDPAAALQIIEALRDDIAASDEDLRGPLERLATLSRAASEGVAEAIALVSAAITLRESVKTYDSAGRPRKVETTANSIGRY
ncbi:hypothetical protein [Paracoccus jeotgali]|uniref:Uncharacterized protein n=1 Tax=Paracoccus jeotgali TaxID=2065379 RepID=A0A2K9MHD7_9RHOB|nr:hypothetical protein [Paracoccus jeotgali]AUM74902.1 hypothetical protein CYR75_11985 [Paracoccus jeotgali]